MIDERPLKLLNRNLKLFPSYLALTWDVIFVWTISVMFFTSQKGLTYSQTVLLDSILMAFGACMAIPVSKIFQNVKSITCTRIGLFSYGCYLLLCIVGSNYAVFVCAEFFLAFGYVLCGIKTNNILIDTLFSLKKNKLYQKIYGRGMAIFYSVEAVGAVAITYVFSYSPYLCYWISFSVVVLALVLSLFFVDANKFQVSNVKGEAIPTTKIQLEKSDSVFKILSSSFFVFLLIYVMLFRGVLSASGSNLKIYLQELMNNGKLPLWSFGYLYAIQKLCSAISSKYQFKFNLRFGVKSLIIFVVCAIVSFLVCGLLYVFAPQNYFVIAIILIMSYIQGSLRIPNTIFINNYLQICIAPKNRDRAYAIRTTAEYIGFATINALYAFLLTRFNDNYGLTNVLYIAIITIPLVIAFLLFIRALIKQYAQKFTIVKDEYTKIKPQKGKKRS